MPGSIDLHAIQSLLRWQLEQFDSQECDGNRSEKSPEAAGPALYPVRYPLDETDLVVSVP